MSKPDHCTICGKRLIPNAGDPKSPLLIASEFPSWEEVRAGRPFAGPAGEVLRKELARVGLSYLQFRVTNLWLHEPLERGRTNASKARYAEELEWHLQWLIEEMQGRQAILLLGSDVTQAVLGYPVMDVAGLPTDVLPPNEFLFPRKTRLVMAAPNPAIVYQPKQVAGEFQLALSNFAQALAARKVKLP